MSSWLATAAVAGFIKKKESSIAPYKRAVEHVEEEQRKALENLENATVELVKVVAERIPNER